MPDDPDAQQPAPDLGAPPGPEGQPDEEELRRRIEEGMRKVRVQDVLLESVVTIINLTARRIGKPDERDLEQARVGIEAVRSLVDLLEPEPQTQVRNALSELQMLYARGAGGDDGEPGAGEEGDAAPTESGETPTTPAEGGDAAAQEPRTRPGGEAPPGLWVPPGS
jgi:hypothetical protein